jgi:rare lipoprotein A
MVNVLNLENNRSVAVRITDRGPFVAGRIIDLSLRAAQEIAMVGPGTALVRLDLLPDPPAPSRPVEQEPPPSLPAEPEAAPQAPRTESQYAVQVGAFRERAAAERLQQQITSRYGPAFIEDFQSSAGLVYRVRVGPRPSLLDAQRLAVQLENDHLQNFVVQLD